MENAVERYVVPSSPSKVPAQLPEVSRRFAPMVVVEMTPPSELVARSEFGRLLMAKLVVVALPAISAEELKFVDVELVKIAFVEKRFVEVALVDVEKVLESATIVEDAFDMRPLEKIMRDVVALCPAAGCVHASYAEEPVASVPQTTFPAESVSSAWEQEVSAES